MIQGGPTKNLYVSAVPLCVDHICSIYALYMHLICVITNLKEGCRRLVGKKLVCFRETLCVSFRGASLVKNFYVSAGPFCEKLVCFRGHLCVYLRLTPLRINDKNYPFPQRSCSVVVITLASHARGLRFEPGQEQFFAKNQFL